MSRFVLLKFFGRKDGERELFDAYVISAEEGYSFPIAAEGYDSIEVYTEPVPEP